VDGAGEAAGTFLAGVAEVAVEGPLVSPGSGVGVAPAVACGAVTSRVRSGVGAGDADAGAALSADSGSDWQAARANTAAASAIARRAGRRGVTDLMIRAPDPDDPP
jgi:hypothetical protein